METFLSTHITPVVDGQSSQSESKGSGSNDDYVTLFDTLLGLAIENEEEKVKSSVKLVPSEESNDTDVMIEVTPEESWGLFQLKQGGSLSFSSSLGDHLPEGSDDTKSVLNQWGGDLVSAQNQHTELGSGSNRFGRDRTEILAETRKLGENASSTLSDDALIAQQQVRINDELPKALPINISGALKQEGLQSSLNNYGLEQQIKSGETEKVAQEFDMGEMLESGEPTSEFTKNETLVNHSEELVKKNIFDTQLMQTRNSQWFQTPEWLEFIKQNRMVQPDSVTEVSTSSADPKIHSSSSIEQPVDIVTAMSEAGRVRESEQASPTLRLIIPLHTKEWSDKFAQSVKLLIANQLQEAKIEVDPPELGPISIKLALNNQDAHVQFQAQHAATREQIEQALPRLKELLQEAGYNLEQSDVNQGYQDQGGGKEHGSTESLMQMRVNAAEDSNEPEHTIKSVLLEVEQKGVDFFV